MPEQQKFILSTNVIQTDLNCSEAILVIDARHAEYHPFTDRAGRVQATSIPRKAVQNLDPYVTPAPVTAGGGYVFRFDQGFPEVLLIFRRGAWDLPKGKQTAGESIESCALREVGEEIGARQLRIVRSLGTTLHGYREDTRYLVKTTHWFLMLTSERRFKPEEREGIQAVEWVPWKQAPERITFETLRDHMARIDPMIQEYASNPHS